jgi:hypothetical protein
MLNNNENKNQSLQDLDIVSPEMMTQITGAVMEGQEKISESYLFRSAYSFAEFAASCEFAELSGLRIVN